MANQDWAKLPPNDVLEKTQKSLTEHGFKVVLVQNKTAALEELKSQIPQNAEVMTGSSTTLYQIGFMDLYIQGKLPLKALGPLVFSEKDPLKQADLRRKSVCADYFIASVNAVTQNGELIAVDRTGSRVTAYPFAAKKLILVIGTQKITANLEAGFRRIREYVVPLENDRAKKAYGIETAVGKWVIIEREFQKDRITIILVKEALGF